MKFLKWLESRGVSTGDFVKIMLLMGFLSTFVIFMLYGAIGALIL